MVNQAVFGKQAVLPVLVRPTVQISAGNIIATMPIRRICIIATLAGLLVACGEVARPVVVVRSIPTALPSSTATATQTATPTATPVPTATPHPLSIAALRQGEYPGSRLAVEQPLESGINYSRSIVSYQSEGLKIYALLTVPFGERPAAGWPVIVFNHGYIPPAEYRTTERYVNYMGAFSRSGYIVLRPDYRGHGNSEGVARGAYGSPDYVVDVLNAVSAIKQYADTDPARIGMWGHSMGGYITLRVMVTTRDIKAGVIWAGVVASYPDLVNNWRRLTVGAGVATPVAGWGTRWIRSLSNAYGSPQSSPNFWSDISANSFLPDISGPLQLHHGSIDQVVPAVFSETLHEQLRTAGQPAELYLYPQGDHNLRLNFEEAMQRTLRFFEEHLN
jgi:alpha-beta hydrolase superfamily lysophospholipase